MLTRMVSLQKSTEIFPEKIILNLSLHQGKSISEEELGSYGHFKKQIPILG